MIAPSDGLPVRPRPLALPAERGWWWLGCHGGAGVTSLAALIGGGAEAGRGWPNPPPEQRAPVVLVARTHATGLLRAQSAARQWASQMLPGGIDLLGLVLLPDAPGDLPRPLEELARLVSGGVPECWRLPWIEELRYGDLDTVPRLPALRRLGLDLSRSAYRKS